MEGNADRGMNVVSPDRGNTDRGMNVVSPD